MSQQLVACPHCRGQMLDDGSLAGQLVMCPHCHCQIQMPPRSTPSWPQSFSQPAETLFSQDRVDTRSSYRRRPRRTDIFAVICFASGLLSLLFLAVVFAPLSYITGIISYYRLKEDPDLQGKGLRLAGVLMGLVSLLYVCWLFEVGPFMPR